jgi:xanthine dehydrogenase accessory factor
VSETTDVLEAITKWHEAGRKTALATIVGVKGSTYRRPGAHLLVAEDGQMVGNLSGGCLEGEVYGVAESVIASGKPQLAFYDLTADDEVVWGWGLGCNGAIEVFVEPAEKAAEIASALRRAIEEERAVAVVTVLDSETSELGPGDRTIVYEGEVIDGRIGAEAAAAMESGDTSIRVLDFPDGSARIFIEVIEPSLRLLICGAGHDAIPLVATAAALGWRVDVADDRESLLSHERFPGARRFVQSDPGKITEAAEVDKRTFVVVMSHNYLRDRDYLRSLLDSDAAYVGMLGPRARLQRLLDDLSSDGVTVDKSREPRLHGPAGLDIGAEGPEEIATAIVGEVLAVRRQREAGFLRERSTPIHSQGGSGPV